jgi:hypothetical protein
MDELKTRTMEVIDGINKDWTDTMDDVREYVLQAQTKNELDVSVLFSMLNTNKVMKNFSSHLKKLDQCFIEAKSRIGKNKKGGFFS